MVKQNTKEQILSIEEQIKRLKEKQKRILNNTQREIGKYLMDSWEVEDVNEAKELIDSFNNQVKSLSEASSSKEDNEEEKNFSLNPPKG
ncbi:hypothetical protein CN689_22675 [Peribacillus butanolivorans]|uniref:Uncharacterized protein n=1 Tax=Peribacillus butanolivorans TaxID=421767 RepID=A0AAX0S0F7_9BACI|nr:hypothetical protein [Peribacillus butanolivorans]PEJ28222.1 hypothetical protein CN689_22675 [Peribacillus butanolivorans]